MSERLGPSAISGRAGPGTRAPVRAGAPPGGRSLESFSPKISSAKPRTPSFESVRPLDISKVPNRIPSGNREAFSIQTPAFTQLTPENKSQIKTTQKIEVPQVFKNAFTETKPEVKSTAVHTQQKKGSERFAALGNTQEYKPSFSTNRINRSIDPLDKPVAKSEVMKMQKVTESQPQQKANVEIPQAFQKAFINSHEPVLNPTKPKISEVFQKAFEGSPDGALDPTKARVPKAFVEAFPDGKVLDPSIPKPIPAETSPIFPVEVPKVDIPPIPDVVVNKMPEVSKEIAKRNTLPKGSLRFNKSPELIAKLHAQKGSKIENPLDSQITAPIPIAEIKPEVINNQSQPTEKAKIAGIESNETKMVNEIATAPLETKRQLVTKLLKDQTASLPEALLKENDAFKKDIPVNTRRDLIKKIIGEKSTLSLSEALQQPIDKAQLASEVTSQTSQQTKIELLKKVLTTQGSMGLIDASKIDASMFGIKPDVQTAINEVINSQVKAEAKSGAVSVEVMNKSLDQMKNIGLLTNKEAKPIQNLTTLIAAAHQTETKERTNATPIITPAILEQVTNQDFTLDLSKARELLRQNEQFQPTTVETTKQAAIVIKKEEDSLNGEAITSPELQTKVVQLAEMLLNPDQKVVIQSSKRHELIETLTELGKTTQYKESPQLQQAVTVLLKEQTEQIIEEQQVSSTIQSMVEAGIEPQIIQNQITPIVEQKQLIISADQLNEMIETTIIRIQTKMEQQYIEEEELDEYELMLQRIRMLYIELDDIAMQYRIETSLKALEKAFEQAYQEGRESITGSEIYNFIPKEEPSSEKSELIKMLNIDRNDGSRVEYTKTVNTEETFDSPAKAYEFIMNALFANRPGRLSENPTNPLLSQQEIEKIYREQSYPTAKVVSISSYNKYNSAQLIPPSTMQKAA